MPKQDHETYLDYKKRVLDQISPSFCAAKWLNATIRLEQGKTTSCHLPPEHKISRFHLIWNPSAIHNTQRKKRMRKMMLHGLKPQECEYCWKIEKMGDNAISDRIFKSEIYSDQTIADLTKLNPKKDINLKTLEVSFDRNCNLACSYCNKDNSTTWLKDLKTNGGYRNLYTKDAVTYTSSKSQSQILKSDKNPYIKAFWKWWPELSTSLEELRVTGGEPLMSPDVWKLMDYFSTNQLDHVRLAINSNLCANDELIKRFIDKSKKIKNLILYTSNEAFGSQAEYIRDGLDYNLWRSNIFKLIKQGNIKQLNLMMTINSLCLYSITQLFDDILSWRKHFDRPVAVWTMNILRFPSFMSPLLLPTDLKAERINHLKSWLNNNKDNKYLVEMEIAAIERLIEYLGLIKKPHLKSNDRSLELRDFKNFYSQYDQRRGKSFNDTFPPILTQWLEEL